MFTFPEDGLHNVTIYGTDSYGDEYRSEFKIFTTGTTYTVVEGIEQHEMPTQWSDYSHTYGTNGGTGSTEINDDVYAYVNAGVVYGTETYLGYIKPGIQGQESDADLITNWNNGDGTPHWSKLDEATGDMNGDGGNIREVTPGIDDRWKFTTLDIPENAIVSKLVMWMYVKHGSSDEPITVVKATSNVGVVAYEYGGNNFYEWEEDITTGLSLSQAQLDGLWINVEPYNLPYGEDYVWVDIETVYIEVWYRTVTYRLTTEVTFTIPSEDLFSIDTLYYDYATTEAILYDLDIWDYDLGDWKEDPLENDIETTDYVTGSFALTDNYISGSNEILIRFETVSGYDNDFDLRLDQLMIKYYTDIPKTL